MYDKIITKVDRDTGEVIASTTRSEEQDKGWIKHCGAGAGKEAASYCSRKQSSELGNFVWLLYNIGSALDIGLRPADLARVIYLSTFMNYENYLTHDDGKTKIKYSEIGKVLKVGRDTTLRFLSSASESGILAREAGTSYVKLCSDVFAKGRLEDIAVNKDAMRLYIRGVREVYSKAKLRDHKDLSYVFQAIPYVSLDYNIVCSNPRESVLDNVEPLTLTQYCTLVGYEISHASRLRSVLRNITIDNEGVFGFVDTVGNDTIIINPRVFYAGKQYERVMECGKFFKRKVR